LQPLQILLLYLGTFTPGLLALALTLRSEGRAGVRALLGRLVQGSAGLGYYVFALGYMFAIKLTAAVIHRVVIGAWPEFGRDPWYLMIVAALFSTLIGGQTGEETGWRGYALPRLSAHLGLGPASLVLGVVWAVWHLPLFFYPGTDTRGQSFPLYAAQVTAVSVAIAWLYGRTQGSLLLTMLLHASINNTKDIVPSRVPGATNVFALSTSPVAWISAVLLWIGAIYFLVSMRRGRLGVDVTGT
jgi:membrane protease YdiL (CAAX protease family)